MQKNDLIELTIEDIGMDGAGIGRYHGMAGFFNGALVWDQISGENLNMKIIFSKSPLEGIKKGFPGQGVSSWLYVKGDRGGGD